MRHCFEAQLDERYLSWWASGSHPQITIADKFRLLALLRLFCLGSIRYLQQ